MSRRSLEELLAHRTAIQNLARSMLGDPHAADDVVQDTFVAALRHAPEGGATRAWLSRVARNFALRSRRSARRRERRQAITARSERTDDPDAVARLESHRQLATAVAELEEPFRSTILLRYFEGLSTSAIGARMNVAPATVRTRIHRGLERLRARLDADDRRGWRLVLAPLLLLPDKSFAAAALAAALLIAATLLVAYVQFGSRRPEGAQRAERPGTVAAEERRESGAAPEPRLKLRGRVVTPWNEKLPGATVALLRTVERDARFGFLQMANFPKEPTPPLAVTTTGDGGVFEFDSPAPSGAQLVIAARAPGLAWRVIELPEPGQRNGIVIRLLPTRRITGVVLDPEGDPVAGASVRPMAGAELPGESMTTGDDGAFAVKVGRFETSMRPARWRRQVLIERKPFLPALLFVFVDQGNRRIVLQRPTPLEGTVVDAEKRLVAGADVRVAASGIGFETRTDKSGRFRFPGAAPARRSYGAHPGTIDVFVDAGSRGHREYRWVPWTPGVPLRIALPPSRRLRGRVVDPEGRGVAGVFIQPSSFSDDDGRFEIASAQLGYVSCRFKHDEYALAPAAETGQPAWAVHAFLANETGEPEREREFLVWRKGIVEGTLRDAEGRPLAGAAVAIVDPKRNQLPSTARTDREGRYRLTSANWSYDRVVRAKKDGHPLVTSSPFRVMRGERKTIDLRCGASGTLQGSVRDTNGAPIADAQIVYGPTFDHAYTAPDGSFRLRRIPIGECHFYITHHKFLDHRQTVEIGHDAKLDVVLERSHVFRGRVLDGAGKPVVGVTVSRSFPRGSSSQGDSYTETGGRGEFEFRDCAPGTCYVHVRGFKHELLPIEVPCDDVVAFRVTRPKSHSTITGTVATDAPGGVLPPDSNVSISAINSEGKSIAYARCDLLGRFRLRGVPDGTVTLRAQSPRHVFPDLPDVPAGATDVIVRATPEGVIEGRCADLEGRPLSGVRVTALPGTGEATQGDAQGPHAFSDALGRFRIERVAADRSTLVAFHRHFALHRRNSVSKDARGLEITLESGLQITGRVEAPADAQPRVRATDALGSVRAVSVDAETGSFVVRGLPPGKCTISFLDRRRRLYAETVAEAGSENLEVQLRKIGLERLRKLVSRTYAR